MQLRLSGRLREVVAYKNRTTGRLFLEVENNLLRAVSHLRSSMLSLKFFVSE